MPQDLQDLLRKGADIPLADEVTQALTSPEFVKWSVVANRSLALVLGIVETDFEQANARGRNVEPYEIPLRALRSEQARGIETISIYIISTKTILYDLFVSDDSGELLAIARRRPPIVIDSPTI